MYVTQSVGTGGAKLFPVKAELTETHRVAFHLSLNSGAGEPRLNRSVTVTVASSGLDLPVADAPNMLKGKFTWTKTITIPREANQTVIYASKPIGVSGNYLYAWVDAGDLTNSVTIDLKVNTITLTSNTVDPSQFATAAQGALADSSIQPSDILNWDLNAADDFDGTWNNLTGPTNKNYLELLTTDQNSRLTDGINSYATMGDLGGYVTSSSLVSSLALKLDIADATASNLSLATAAQGVLAESAIQPQPIQSVTIDGTSIIVDLQNKQNKVVVVDLATAPAAFQLEYINHVNGGEYTIHLKNFVSADVQFAGFKNEAGALVNDGNPVSLTNGKIIELYSDGTELFGKDL